MTRISSYCLLQCTSCGQKHILPNYGSINLTFDPPPTTYKPDDLWVCQRCSERKPLKNFIPLGILNTPNTDSTPKWYKPIRRFFDKTYKNVHIIIQCYFWHPKKHYIQHYSCLMKTPRNIWII